jgi:hypothetical protein
VSDKTASVKVTLNSRGFIAGLRDLEGKADAAGRGIASRLAAGMKRAISSIGSAIMAVPKLLSNGVMAGLRGLQSGALSVAKRIGDSFKSAFGGLFGKKAARKKKDEEEDDDGGKKKGSRTLAGATSVFLGNMATKVATTIFDKTVGMIAGANDVSDKANRISIGARGAGADYVDPKVLTAEFYAVASNVKGITADAAADAAARFVSMTGDLDTARKSMMDFATASAASGTDLESVAATAAAISQQFKITDPAQIKDVLAALIYQGKSGAFELKDAASLFPRLASAGAAFGLEKGASGVKTLGGLTQIAMQGTGSGETAATAVENLLTNLKTKSGDLGQAGVKVYENGKIRDLPKLIVESIAKVGGSDVGKKNEGLTKIFGEQGIRAINPLISQFNDVFKGTKGTDAQKTAAGMKALEDALNGAINAPGTWADVVQDSAQAQATTSARMTSAMQRLEGAVASQLLPKIADFAEGLANSPDKIDAFIEAISLAGEALGFFVNLAKASGLIKDPSALQQSEQKEAEATKLGKERIAAEQALKSEKDPAKQAELKNKIDQLDRRSNTAGFMSQQLQEQSAEKSGVAIARNGIFGGFDTSRFAEQAKVAAGVPVPAAEAKGGSRAAPARIASIDGEVRVRVTNASDISGAAGQTPGWVPRN